MIDVPPNRSDAVVDMDELINRLIANNVPTRLVRYIIGFLYHTIS